MLKRTKSTDSYADQRHRLFFALEPPHPIRERISELQKSLGLEGRAVRPEQYHITLAFLGMQDTGVIPRLLRLGESLAMSACDLELDHVGSFKRAGVLWLGAQQIPEELTAFQSQLVDGLETNGIDRDRKPWKLHLMLYRRLRKPCRILPIKPVTWRLNTFSLIESIGVRNGVKYVSRGHWKATHVAAD